MTLEKLIAQKPYENRVAVYRRHWIILIRDLAIPIILAAIPFAVYAFLRSQFPELLQHPVGYPALVLAASAYEIGTLLLLFAHFIDFELDMWVVTNDRFVNIEQQGLLARTVAELDLWRVQDVAAEVKGLLPTLLDYGDVFVQTAGARARFVLEQVPNPNAVRKFILDMADIDRKFHQQDILATKLAASTG